MRRALLLFAALAALVTAGACALDEAGLLVDGGGEASALEAGGADVAEPCSTLDAACLGPLDAAWKPIALADGGCGAGFTPETWETNPRDVDGSCACGACQVVGAYACDAGVTITGGDDCGDSPPLATAVPGACKDVNETQHLEAHSVQATGTVGCLAPNDAGSGAVTDELALCVPGCSADFCGGTSRCVYAEGDVPCPAGFQFFARAGTGVDPGCAPCACEAGPPGTCGGSVTAYFQSGCSASDDAGTFAVDTCNYIKAKYQSVLVSLTPPATSCVVTGPPGGDPTLVGEKTVCCQ